MDIHLKRYSGNPILTPTNNKWENKAVFNCGATIVDNRVLLLYRAQGDDNISRFGLAYSDDGYTISERLPDPVFEPDIDTEYETLGVEDPRISKIGDSYYIVYTAASLYPSAFSEEPEERPAGEIPWRVRLSIAHTHDFRTFTRHGVIISHIDSKDGVLFPELVNDRMLLIHRIVPEIRLAVAEDINHFKERGPIIGPRGSGWDSNLVGAGAPPIRTPHGWVMIYHGVDDKHHYGLGLALIDPHDPSHILARSKSPILTPEEQYEKEGQINNVVFSCGAVKKGDELLVYYGAADTVVGVASMPYQHLLDWASYNYNKYHSR